MYFRRLLKLVKHHTPRNLTIHVFKNLIIYLLNLYLLNLSDFTDQSFAFCDNPWNVSVKPSKLFYNETVRLEIPGTSHIEVIIKKHNCSLKFIIVQNCEICQGEGSRTCEKCHGSGKVNFF